MLGVHRKTKYFNRYSEKWPELVYIHYLYWVAKHLKAHISYTYLLCIKTWFLAKRRIHFLRFKRKPQWLRQRPFNVLLKNFIEKNLQRFFKPFTRWHLKIPLVWKKIKFMFLKRFRRKYLKKKFWFRFKWRYRKEASFKRRLRYLAPSVISFRKIKKRTPVQFNYLKYIRIISYLKIFNRGPSKYPLIRRIFTTKRFVKRSLKYYFYKRVKLIWKKSTISLFYNTKVPFKSLIKHNSTIFSNVNKPLLRKLRDTRALHWSTQQSGKINERRYKNFLFKAIPFSIKKGAFQHIISFFAQLSGYTLSWRHFFSLYKHGLFAVNNQKQTRLPILGWGDVLAFTISASFNEFQKFFKSKMKKNIQRAKRWSYLGYRRFKNRKLVTRRSLPKYVKALSTGFKAIGREWVMDFFSKSGLLVRNFISGAVEYVFNITDHTALKLNNWKWKG